MSFIICLMGPTASGKTQLAIDLTRQLPCDIISVDSAMVYRGMDIGTAKPSIEQQILAPHRLINICDPAQAYSAGQFKQDALCEIENILSQGRIPLLVGGTMLYFHVLQRGLSELPAANAEIRVQIVAEAAQQGWENLHMRLQQVDPVAAQRIHCHDAQRISRALEIYALTGKTLTELTQAKKSLLPYRIINLAIAPADREIIHQRVALRFKNMLQQGFVEEVTSLLHRGDLTRDMPSMRAVGYRQVWDYLDGKYNHEQMQERGIIATRQLAKRQLTWLRGWEGVQWFDSEDKKILKKILEMKITGRLG